MYTHKIYLLSAITFDKWNSALNQLGRKQGYLPFNHMYD